MARLLPVADGLFVEARLGRVMRQQLRLRLAERRKSRLQHLGNVLMVPLSGAPQQGLIGGFLDQSVLEKVRRLRWQALLIQELRVYELLQPTPQGALVPG